MSQPPGLRRSLSLTQLTLYGVGTTVGAGIYALIGELAGQAGNYMPVAFLIAAVLVALSALSFAELSSRYPQAAGEATYVRAAFSSGGLALLVGLLVVGAGLVSSATIVNGFVGYLAVFIELPPALAIVGLMLALTGLCVWGIGQSVNIAGFITVLEVGGLLLVLWNGGASLADLPARWREFVPPLDAAVWTGIVAGSFLAFYAFIGFEDMVNVAEEVRSVERTLPRAIVLTLLITTLLYVSVGTVAVLNLSPAELQASAAPLALLYERTGGAAGLLSGIALLAVINGALVQMIMASRVLYGLARLELLPAALGRVHATTRTPVTATLLVGGVIVLAALSFDLLPLARATSYLTLAVFAIVNLALMRIKLQRQSPAGPIVYPFWVPLGGFLVSAGFLVMELMRALFA